MLKPRVLNLLTLGPDYQPTKDDTYIGRANKTPNATGGRFLPISKWANTHVIKRDEERVDAVERFRQDVLKNRALLGALHELEGQNLLCWCDPKPCHGHVLAEMVAALSKFPVHQLRAKCMDEVGEDDEAKALEWAIENGVLAETVTSWKDADPLDASAWILRDVGAPAKQPELF